MVSAGPLVAVLAVMALPVAAHGDAGVTISPAAGQPGTQVTLRGHGFGPSQAVVVRRGRSRLARARSSRRGGFRVRLTIPGSAGETVRLRSASRSRRVENRFRVLAPGRPESARERATGNGWRLRWSPTGGAAGTLVRLRGSGFAAKRPVRARFAGEAVARARTDRRGRFAIRLVAPTARSARRRITVGVRSGKNRLRFGFTVTASGPGGPPPPEPRPAEAHGPRSKPVFAVYYLWWTRNHWLDRLGPNYPHGDRPNPLPARLDDRGCVADSLYPDNKLTDVSQGLAYDQSNPAVVERDVRLAAGAGIAGFAANWAGTGSTGQTPSSTAYHQRLQWLFDAVHKVNAEGIPFKLQLNYKTASRPSTTHMINDLGYFVDRYGADPALDHSYSSKPELVWTGSWKYSDEEKASVSRAFRSRMFLIADDKAAWDTNSAASFDGNSWYWPGQDPYDNPQSFDQVKRLAGAVRSTPNPDGSRKVWLAPLAPGYNPVLLYGGDTCVPRRDGETISRLYRGNLASKPDGWLFISWNEIAEASHIVPLTRYDRTSLDAIGKVIAAGE